MAILLASAPPLLMGLVVGVIISVFQAVTSIQEPTLAFIPKIVAVLLSLLLFGPFIITTLRDYFINLYNAIPYLITPR
jgi:flagellar biosynthetic protein FliQ